MPTTTDRAVADRYGRGFLAGHRRLAVGAAAFVIAAALAWFAWVAWSGQSSATGTDVGFVVVDDGTVQVTFDVTKPADRTATCTIQALDPGFAVVGTVRVQIGPAEHGVVRQTATVRTTNRATAGRVESCTVSR